MGLNKVLSLIAFVAVLLPAIAMGKEIMVGDDSGWKLKFNYQDWAKDKVFQVGDILVFKYTPPNHNVYKVNGTEFKDCTKSSTNDALFSGNDKIELKTEGNKWYICGVEGHCDSGMKLNITVMNKSPAAPGIILSGYQVFMIVISAILAIVM